MGVYLHSRRCFVDVTTEAELLDLVAQHSAQPSQPATPPSTALAHAAPLRLTFAHRSPSAA